MRRVRNRPKIYSNDFHGSGSHLSLITLFNFFFANQKRLAGEKSIMVQNFGVLRLACVPLPVCVPVYPDLSGTRRGFQGGAVPISSGYNREPHHRFHRDTIGSRTIDWIEGGTEDDGIVGLYAVAGGAVGAVSGASLVSSKCNPCTSLQWAL